jgi:phage internal scaffolding protein
MTKINSIIKIDPPFNTAYGKKERVYTDVGDVSLTKQAFKDQCDINFIMKNYEKTGIAPINQRQPQYGDFTQVNDYHSALNSVIAAQDHFMSLPAELRARFSNDPGEFISFVENPDNKEELGKLGLLKQESVQNLDSFNKKNPMPSASEEEV